MTTNLAWQEESTSKWAFCAPDFATTLGALTFLWPVPSIHLGTGSLRVPEIINFSNPGTTSPRRAYPDTPERGKSAAGKKFSTFRRHHNSVCSYHQQPTLPHTKANGGAASMSVTLAWSLPHH